MSTIIDLPSFSLRNCEKCALPCCEFAEPPFLTRHDIDNIRKALQIPEDHFAIAAETLASPQVTYKMKTDHSGKCIFFDANTRRCRIYQYRPIDCKLFPLDIDIRDDTYVWMLYLCCPTPVASTEAAEMVRKAEEELLPDLATDIHAYATAPMWLFSQGKWVYVANVRQIKTDR